MVHHIRDSCLTGTVDGKAQRVDAAEEIRDEVPAAIRTVQLTAAIDITARYRPPNSTRIVHDGFCEWQVGWLAEGGYTRHRAGALAHVPAVVAPACPAGS